jgi:molybdopterin-guanine dinucleotide biosynthesis protein B
MRVFGFAGRSGSGKTTLAEQVLRLLISGGTRVSVIKHTHHAVDLETPGKDTWRFREAGASQVVLASAARWALMQELRGAAEPELPALLAMLSACDLVLVEGFKRHSIPRLEVFRAGNGSAPLYCDDPHIIALATDASLPTALPTFGLDDFEGVAAFIQARAVELR